VSPTARSLRLLRQWGYVADVCERFIAAIQRRRDFLRIGDIIGAHKVHGFLMVQATSASNVSARLKKARGVIAMRTWLAAGGKFEVHGWAKNKSGRWAVRRVAITGENLAPVEVSRKRMRVTPKKQGSLFE